MLPIGRNYNVLNVPTFGKFFTIKCLSKVNFSQGESSGCSLQQTVSHQSTLFCQVDCKHIHTHTQARTCVYTHTHTEIIPNWPIGECRINTPMNKM